MRTIPSEVLRSSHSNLIRSFEMRELSLGKMAKLLEINKVELRKALSALSRLKSHEKSYAVNDQPLV